MGFPYDDETQKKIDNLRPDHDEWKKMLGDARDELEREKRVEARENGLLLFALIWAIVVLVVLAPHYL